MRAPASYLWIGRLIGRHAFRRPGSASRNALARVAILMLGVCSVGLVAGAPAAMAAPAAQSLAITNISPTTGSAAGGTTVTVTGTGFVPGATTITFGTTPARATSCLSATSCTVQSPPGVGVALVSAQTAGGQFTDNVSPYTYQSSVTSISPTHGPQAGGTQVTITGVGLDFPGHLTLFDFGQGDQVSATCQSSTTCAVTTPQGSGTVDVTVGIFNGSGYSFSPASPGDQFVYDAPPQPQTINLPIYTVTVPAAAGPPPSCVRVLFICVPPPPFQCKNLTYVEVLQHIQQCLQVNVPNHDMKCGILDILDLSCLPTIDGKQVSFSLKIGGGFSPAGPGLNSDYTEVVVFSFGPVEL
jgi:hypothetical protein